MKTKLYYLLIPVVLISFIGCSGTKKLSKAESFESFSKKFYQDSAFQYSRILFPIELEEHMGGIKTELENEKQSNIETKQFTEKTLPQVIKSIDAYPEFYKRKLDTTATGIDEQIFIPSSGYMEVRSFILEKRKWYLRHVMIMNL